MSRFRRPSTGTVLAFVALVIALGGTALAATGTVVNIADGTNPSYVAQVTSQGSLKTVGTLPRNPFTRWNFVFNGDSSQIVPPNTATVALTHVRITNYWGNTVPTNVVLFQYSVSSGSCNGYVREVGRFIVGVNGQVDDDYATPIFIYPPGGGVQWCLVAAADAPSSGTSNWAITVGVNGFTPNGTGPTTSAPPAPSAAAEQGGSASTPQRP